MDSLQISIAIIFFGILILTFLLIHLVLAIKRHSKRIRISKWYKSERVSKYICQKTAKELVPEEVWTFVNKLEQIAKDRDSKEQK